MVEKYKFLKHTGDIKFQSFGKTLEKAFENSALALAEIMTKKTKIVGKIKKKIAVYGKDDESLLLNFLEEFLYLLDAEDFVLSSLDSIKIVEGKIVDNEKALLHGGTNSNLFNLSATLIGDKASKYNFSNDVKAITYNSMKVSKTESGFMCQVVVDV